MQQIATALVKAQRDFAPALKQSVNPHFRSKYANLGDCIDAVIDALNNNGIALVQRTLDCDNGVAVETMFVHESGETMSGGVLHVPAAKQDPQGYGSALTYARRYSLMAACGIAPEDDDANAASKTRPSHLPRMGGATISTGKDGSVTASFNPPTGEVSIIPSDERITQIINTLNACETLVNLQVEWGNLTKEEQKLTIDVKDEVKTALTKSQKTKG